MLLFACICHNSTVYSLHCSLSSDVAPPTQPSNVQYNAIFYGTSYLAGDIEWDFSANSPVDNFTITVSYLNGSIGLMRTTKSSPVETVTLYYNTDYTITVIGRNCGGSSIPTVLSYMQRENMFNLIWLWKSSFTYCLSLRWLSCA